MLWDKGLKEYVEAAKIIKEKYDNVEFQLLGFTDVKNKAAISTGQMDKWVNDGYVKYLGISDNVQQEIAKADCIVLPSYYREGTPKSLLECASMAKAIVTTDAVGCRNVVDNGVNGFLCKVRDTEDLVIKLEMMLNLSEEQRIEMGKRVEKKWSDNLMNKLLSINI